MNSGWINILLNSSQSDEMTVLSVESATEDTSYRANGLALTGG